MRKSIATIIIASTMLIGCATQPMSQRDYGTPETTPTNRFEINRTDGTAFDTKTKLTWKICAKGQSYSGGHCTGYAIGFAWDNAMQTFVDKGDNWRLPNVDELNSIVEKRYRNPAINMTIFPDTPPLPFWAALSYAPNQAMAWHINFSNGISGTSDKAHVNNVRLVRGEQWFDKEASKRAELAEQQKRKAELAEAQRKLEAEQAEKDAYITCDNKANCDKTFSLAQIYINSMASQKIQVATDTIVETYNPTENGNIGMSAIKIPGKGSSSVVRLTVMCKVDDGGIYDKVCGMKKLDIYNGFRPFINKMLSD